jgi:hypothetical protein
MTDTEREQLAENIDKLPEPESVLTTLFEGVVEGLFHRRWRRLRR